MRRRHPLISGVRLKAAFSFPGANPIGSILCCTSPPVSERSALASGDRFGHRCGAAVGGRLISAVGITGGDATRRREKAFRLIAITSSVRRFRILFRCCAEGGVAEHCRVPAFLIG